MHFFFLFISKLSIWAAVEKLLFLVKEKNEAFLCHFLGEVCLGQCVWDVSSPVAAGSSFSRVIEG